MKNTDEEFEAMRQRAFEELKLLRKLVDDFCDADAGDIQCDCTFLDCVCEEDGYRLALEALHNAANAWNGYAANA